jgi:DNA-binding NarL/FixJ family response regulator
MEASTATEALDKLERADVGAVIASLDLPAGGGKGLAKQMRGDRNLEHIPVLALCNSQAEADVKDDGDFVCRAEKFDRESVLLSLERLLNAVEPAGQPELAGSRR